MSGAGIIELGPFRLHKSIGQGAMGEVWRGVHVGQGTPVAVKILLTGQAREARYRKAFRTEIQAVAALHHPRIVMVLDYGEVPEEVAANSGGQLEATSPYLVMELASGGSLDQIDGALSWSVIKAVLLSVLDGLAHAHARGVIHRDIKPANVLVARSDDQRPGLKLTDFGIAHAANRGSLETAEQLMGTPHYMAPEQFEGNWRNFGPWTDLYAVGCMAWELACGEVPFDGDSFMQQAYFHLHGHIPALVPRRPMPKGFEVWLRRLLQKRPEHRFQRAADAALALQKIGEPVSMLDSQPMLPIPASTIQTGQGPENVRLDADRWCLAVPTRNTPPPLDAATSRTLIIPEDALMMIDEERVEDPMMSRAMPHFVPKRIKERPKQEFAGWDPALDVPPVPETWRRAIPPGPGMKLVGAGLGLYGLRAVPLVGRTHERDLIWSALRNVSSMDEARIVLLRGPAGVGKSRLAEWVCQRAHEAGAATVLHASHSAIAGPADGLPRMLAQHMGCVGLSYEELQERVRDRLADAGVTNDYEWRALVDLMAPGAVLEGEIPESIKWGSAREWCVLVRRFIERLTAERPVIVWLDDIQWGLDALEFAHYLAASPPSAQGPVMVLLTTRDDALAERPSASDRLDALMALRCAADLPVAPLEADSRAQLVQELLGLEGDLAREVERRCAGNPLFAVQLVGDWVQRGVLEVGETGFVLRAGEQARLPDDLHEIWRGRLARALEGCENHWLVALELAAVLGLEVDTREWSEACKQAGVIAPTALVEQLVGHCLARWTERGWAFIHGMLRESIERLSRDADRWARHHLMCGSALARQTAGQRGAAARIGTHYLAAGAYEAALNPLLRGAKEAVTMCRFKEADLLLEKHEDALNTLKMPPSDIRWGEAAVERGLVWRHLGQYEQSLAICDKTKEQAVKYQWHELLPSAILNMAASIRHMGDLQRTEAFFASARELSRVQGDERMVCRAILGMADAATQRGHLERAHDLFSEALALAEQIGASTSISYSLQGLGRVARRQSDITGAANLYRRAYSSAQALGNRISMAVCVNSLGDLERFQGHIEAAEEHYRAAMALYDALDSPEGVYPRANLGLSLLRRGKYAQARPVLEATLKNFEATNRKSMIGFASAALLVCAADAGDWAAWDQLMEDAQTQLRASAFVDPDIATPAQLAGDVAAAAGHPLRAEAAWRLALDQWERLGKHAKAESVLALLSKIRP